MLHSPRVVYQQGDHVCTLYSTREEQLAAAIEYIKAGLSRGERCLYICCEHTPKQFRAALRKAGINVNGEEARGALVIMTKHDGHLKGGSFDPDKMISLLESAVQEALDAGFTGLAAAGDMAWLLDCPPGFEHLCEYEARLNEFYRTHRALGLCQYNRTTLPHEMLDHCIGTHRYIRIDGPILLENPFYEEPAQAAHRSPCASAGVAEKIRRIDEQRIA